MRGTQNPHILDFSGVVTVSHGVLPAPTISPLNENYVEQVKAISASLSDGGKLEVHEFNGMAEFAGVMKDLVEGTRPYELFRETGG